MQDVITIDQILVGLPSVSYSNTLRSLLKTAIALPDRQEHVYKRLLKGEGGIVPIPATETVVVHCATNQVVRTQATVGILNTPIEIEAPGMASMSADIVCLLLAPRLSGAEQLRMLALLSRQFKDMALCDTLRGCHDAAAAYSLLTQSDFRNAA